jgi:hypothetical protein
MSNEQTDELAKLKLELAKISMWVDDFLKDPYDSTYLCVLRLLADYRRLQSQEIEDAIYKLETENK